MERTVEVTTLRNVGIAMQDGTVLAADVTLPGGEGPWPAVVCASPYLKDALIGPNMSWCLHALAERGFAAVLVDLRGTGASGGSKEDAFEMLEASDMYDLIEGVARMPWCNRSVGAWGVSYSAITALKAAAVSPPSLRAIVAIEGSLDAYRCEVMRYAAQGLVMIRAEWAARMLALCALPPIASTPGGAVEVVWEAHTSTLKPWQLPWRRHSSFDEYWEARVFDASRITVPTLIVTSWRDTNPWIWQDVPAFRGPVKVICGPWQHGLPDTAGTEPIDSVGQMVRWWARWLRDEPNGAESDPGVSCYVVGEGVWETHPQWPPECEELVLRADLHGALKPDGLEHAPAAWKDVPYHLTVGIDGGLGMQASPQQQFRDDARSLVFDSSRLPARIDIAGSPSVRLVVRGAEAEFDLAVRLVELREDHTSELITKGLLRTRASTNGSEVARTLITTLKLNPIRYSLREGSRLRMAIARSDFPEVWPAMDTGGSLEIQAGGPETVLLKIPVLSVGRPVATHSYPAPGAASESSVIRQEFNDAWLAMDGSSATVDGGFDSSYTDPVAGTTIEHSHHYTITSEDQNPSKVEVSSITDLVARVGGRTVECHARTRETRQALECSVQVAIDGDVRLSRVFEDREPLG